MNRLAVKKNPNFRLLTTGSKKFDGNGDWVVLLRLLCDLGIKPLSPRSRTVRWNVVGSFSALSFAGLRFPLRKVC